MRRRRDLTPHAHASGNTPFDFVPPSTQNPTGEELLTTLAERRILLSGDEGRLRFRAPEGAIDEPLRDALRTHKETLVSILRTHNGFIQLAPLSYNQLSLFFLHLFDAKTPAYHLALTLRLRSPAEPAILREAAARLVRQHPQLRTTFSQVSLGDRAIPCQFTAEELAPAFVEFDARAWTAETLRERTQAFYATPFDLENGPVVRTGLFTGAETGDILILQLHHIAVDGWSLNLIARDLGRHYHAAQSGQTYAETSTTANYLDFALHQRRWITQADGVAQLDFWRQAMMPPPPPFELGDKKRRPAVRRAVGTTQYFEITATDKARIETCAGQLGVTSFAFLLATFQAFLMRQARVNDLSIGIPTLGRRGKTNEHTVGYFVNPITLRSRRPTAFSFREHVQQTAKELTDALDHRDYPLAALVQETGGSRDPSRTPAFQVLFNLLSRNILGDVVDLLYPGSDEIAVDLGGGLTAGPYPLHQQEGQFDLTLEFVERGPGWTGLFKYCTDLFTNTEATSMVTTFRQCLEQAISSPNGKLELSQPGETAVATTTRHTQQKIAIAATFTAEAMQDAFAFWFERLGWSVELAFAPFNQIFQALLDPNSLFRQNTHGANYVFLRFDDLIELQERTNESSSETAGTRLKANLDALLAVMQSHVPALRVPLCVTICPSSPRFSSLVTDETALRTSFVTGLQAIPGIHCLTPETIANWYPISQWYEPAGEELGHIPYTPAFLTALATSSVRILNAIHQKPIKALVLDCDGTLWDGVVGEVGPEGVKVGPDQQAFQAHLLTLHRAGLLLCLCSKNHETDAWAVFDRHPDMVLKRDHIAFARINWLPKSVNLRTLASEINIGLNAFAFLDDNALERAEVRANCPSVLSPELPTAWAERTPYLKNLWPLDRVRVTEEDQKRSAHYRSERLRTDLRRNATSYTDFLAHLDLVVEIRPAVSNDIERLAQLTLRTNQFNSTLRRLSASEVAHHLAQVGQTAFTTYVRDRFGDYGLVGAAFVRVQNDTLHVDPLLLSCRALGRGVEHQMAAQIGKHALANRCAWVDFPVRPTDRNEPVRTFLQTLARLCSGTRDTDGTLQVASAQLEAVLFSPEDTPLDTTLEPSTSPNADQVDTPQDERIVRLAVAPPTLATLEEELTRWRQQRKRPSPPTGATDTAPLSETERTITTAWKKVLAISHIGTDENFFEAGGTSLLAAQLALELRRQGLAVTIVDLFHYPTISALARNLNNAQMPPPMPVSAASATPQSVEITSYRQLPAPFERLRRFRKK